MTARGTPVSSGAGAERIPAEHGPPGTRAIAARSASSAVLLLARRVVIMAVAAASVAVVARRIGVINFGIFASAQGLTALLAGVADFGFSTVLSREMASAPEGRGGVLGTSVVVASGGGVLAALVQIAVALAAGPGTPRSIVLLILTPTLLATGIGTYRQSFLVLYRVRTLAAIDIATNLAQSVLIIAVAFAGGGLYGVAIVTAAAGVLNPMLVALVGRKMVAGHRPLRDDVTRFLRAALPLGLASFLSSIYFTIDLVILPWLVTRPQVGQYAAAVKFLNLLVTIPGMVMLAVMPGMSSLRHDREGRSELMARVWHWLVAFGLPACVGGAVFAPQIIHLAYGPKYAAAIPMFRVLSAAAAVALISNVFGVVLNALAIARWQVIQNTVAMALNIGANILLAPRYGPMASAWLTLGTELMVATGSLVALRHRIAFRPALALTARPLLATLALGLVGIVLNRTAAAAIPASIAAFALVLVLLRGWPAEFSLAGRYRAGAP